MTSIPLFQQYVYSVISEKKGFPYKQLVMDKEGPGCHEDVIGQNSTLKLLEHEVRWMLHASVKLLCDYKCFFHCQRVRISSD